MIRLRAGCKINLGLSITGVRPDGMHELRTIFYPLACPADEIRLYPSSKPGLELDCAAIPPQENILFRVWEKFPDRPAGLRARLFKRIPWGAGLGGGSSDAAIFLKWLDGQSPANDIDALAASLGADVPFFLRDRPCLAEGVGEKLAPCEVRLGGCFLVLVWPGVSISSAWAYSAYDGLLRNGLTKTASLTRNSNFAGLDLKNDLEEPVFAKWPRLAGLKRRLLELGAAAAAMSGGGSSVYGIFSDKSLANAALCEMRAKWPRAYCLELRDFGM